MDFPWEFGGHFDRSESLPAQGPLRDSLPLSQEDHQSQPKTGPVGWAGGGGYCLYSEGFDCQ